MYLYFYELKLILGIGIGQNKLDVNFFANDGQYYLLLKKSDNFGLNDDLNGDEQYFDKWEKEENEDGTFYLVFIKTTNENFYLGNTKHAVRTIQISYCEEYAEKWSFDEEGTKIMSYNQNRKSKQILRPVEYIGRYFLTDNPTYDNNFSFNVCLTETSNIDKGYVLK